MNVTGMSAPFAYHGGKARLAAAIVARMPGHRVYVEPFAGSLAVLLAKPRTNIELVNDLDGGLVNFWRQLRDRPDEVIAACELTLYARDEYDAAFAEPTDDPVEQARRFWARVQQGIAHKVGTKSGWQCSTSDGRGSTSKAATVFRKIQGLPLVADRLAGVMIERRPAADVIARMDAPHAVHYCDPPYVVSSCSDGGGYAHTMSDDEHRQLADVLADCRGTVLLSGYPSGLYDELYDGWWRVQLPGRADTANRRGTQNRRVEVLWSNRPLPSQQTLDWQDDREAAT